MSATSAVYTDGSSNLTTATPPSGQIGYWTRDDVKKELTPYNTGDSISTSGNITATGSGQIRSAGLLTGSAGADITGGAVNINTNSGSVTNINGGTSTGNVNIGGTGIQNINVGTGLTGASTVAIGSSSSTTNISSGTGAVNINAGTGAATPVNIGTGTSTGTVTIGGSWGTKHQCRLRVNRCEHVGNGKFGKHDQHNRQWYQPERDNGDNRDNDSNGQHGDRRINGHQ